MTITQNNVAGLHRKEWQTMMPAITASAAGNFVVADPLGIDNEALYIATNTVHYLYHQDEDDWAQITSGAFAVAIAAGACGTYYPWSTTYVANSGTTTTISVPAATYNLCGKVKGKTVEFLSGTAANVGLRRTISQILTLGSGNTILTLDSALPSAVVNNDTIRINSGSFFILNAGTLAATNYFKRFDCGTRSWIDRAITGLPATWGTDGKMVSPCQVSTYYDQGIGTSDSNTTTLIDSTKTWTTSQWINYQVRITGGTGCGQVRVITANNTTGLSFAAGVDLDETSAYVIEGDENSIYILGNNALTLYKYSISGNTTATITPSANRAGNAVAGTSADFVGKTGDIGWADTSNIKDGRYIYSLRGAVTTLDKFDITSLAWSVVNYVWPTAWASGCYTWWDTRYIYIVGAGSATVPQRIYKYALRGNYVEPVTTDWYLTGAATLGGKSWIMYLKDSDVKWLYLLGSTSVVLRRIMLF